jgi:transcriptional regulator with GAF, ATPase, and Fis domain
MSDNAISPATATGAVTERLNQLIGELTSAAAGVRADNIGETVAGVVRRIGEAVAEMRHAEQAWAELAPPVPDTGADDWDSNGFEDIIGDSPALQVAIARVHEVAPTDASVVLIGETGTGKELFARAVHNRSARRGRPFVRVNCAALPPTLIETELFGHERGAFTGAVSSRQGRFEVAHRGTLFLDEIGDLPADVQA